MILKFQEPLAGDAIDEVASSRNAVTDGKVARIEKSPDAPIEAPSIRFIERPHEAEELLMGDEF